EARDAGAAGCRFGERDGARPSRRTARGAGRDRHDGAVRLARRGSDGAGEPGAAGAALGLSRAGGAGARGRAAGGVRAFRCGAQAGEGLFGWDAAAARHRRLAGGDAVGAVPRRADDRPRPDRAAAGVADDPRPRAFGRHHPADDPVSGGSRPARRADRRDRPRPQDRRGHQPRAEGGDRLRLPARGAGRPGADRRSGGDPASAARPPGAAQRRGGAAERRRRLGRGGERGGGGPAGGGDRAFGLFAGLAEPRRSLLRADRGGTGCGTAGRRHGSRGMNDVSSVSPASVAAGVPRPRRPSAFSNALVFGWRAVLKFRHVPEQLFDLVMTPIMFTLLFTFVFGGALAGSTDDYLQFFLPGILVQTVAFNAVYSGMGLSTDLGKGLFDRFRSLPIWPLSPFAGLMVGDVLRHLIAGAIILVI